MPTYDDSNFVVRTYTVWEDSLKNVEVKKADGKKHRYTKRRKKKRWMGHILEWKKSRLEQEVEEKKCHWGQNVE